jgi:hypothetical protein
MSNSNININYKYFDDDQIKECDNDEIKRFYVTPNSISQYKELYTNTNNSNANSITGQNFVKDVTKPFTYYSISNEIYYNLENAHDESDCDYYDYYPDNKPTFENDGCLKLYCCGLIGCCFLCLFGCKHHI